MISSRARPRAKPTSSSTTTAPIYPTLPLLIEAGVDIINPWQVNCAGMDDTAKFKREYGRDLTIWGGSCDTQRVLPFGTPD